MRKNANWTKRSSVAFAPEDTTSPPVTVLALAKCQADRMSTVVGTFGHGWEKLQSLADKHPTQQCRISEASGSNKGVFNAFMAKTVGEANQASHTLFLNNSTLMGLSRPPACMLKAEAGLLRAAANMATVCLVCLIQKWLQSTACHAASLCAMKNMWKTSAQHSAEQERNNCDEAKPSCL